MTPIACTTTHDQTVDTMVGLARLPPSCPVIVAGAHSLQLLRALHNRGFRHCAAASHLGSRRGQYAAALIAGDRSHQAVEASLVAVSRVLSAMATIVVSINSDEKGIGLKIRTRLEQLGFRIEAGVRCKSGFLLSAYRCNFASVAKAA